MAVSLLPKLRIRQWSCFVLKGQGENSRDTGQTRDVKGGFASLVLHRGPRPEPLWLTLMQTYNGSTSGHEKAGCTPELPWSYLPSKRGFLLKRIEPEKSETHIYQTQEERTRGSGLKKRQDMTGIRRNLLATPQPTAPSPNLLLELGQLIQAYPRQGCQNYSL